MEERVVNSLKDLGYTGPLLDRTVLSDSLNEGPKSVEYTQLVNFLTTELRTLVNIDELVNVISSPEDSTAFLMELTSFLRELCCPYESLVQGHVSDRLKETSERLLLLDYLASELMAARILQEKKPDNKVQLRLQESPEAAGMRQILTTLGFPKPPANLNVGQLFQKVLPCVQETVTKAGNELVGQGAFKGTLSDAQWESLNAVQKDLNQEYKIRREMLLTRLDVTIQSFQWSDKTKNKKDQFERVYIDNRKSLISEPAVEIADLLAARTDIAIIEKTSNSSVRKNTSSAINKIIIGQVPDRGGRTSEQAPPPPEMPSWQQRSAPGASGGRGGGRGGGGRGGGRGGRGGSARQDQGYHGDNRQGQYSDSRQGQRSDSRQGHYNDNRQGHCSDSRQGYYGDSPQSQGQYNDTRQGQNYYSQNEQYAGSSNRSFDSAGSYAFNDRRDSHYEQTSKRAKTYDSYQTNRTSYADEYARDEQQNRHQQNRGGRSQRNQRNY